MRTVTKIQYYNKRGNYSKRKTKSKSEEFIEVELMGDDSVYIREGTEFFNGNNATASIVNGSPQGSFQVPIRGGSGFNLDKKKTLALLKMLKTVYKED
jgi:hypothetical protein